MGDGTSREDLKKRPRKDLIDIILASIGHARLLQWEWAKSEQRLAKLRVRYEDAVRRLEEANGVIIETQNHLGVDSRAFWMLDDLDGSGDVCSRLHALGYRRTGDGGWYPPERGPQ